MQVLRIKLFMRRLNHLVFKNNLIPLTLFGQLIL
jgi:hypothetical protein